MEYIKPREPYSREDWDAIVKVVLAVLGVYAFIAACSAFSFWISHQ